MKTNVFYTSIIALFALCLIGCTEDIDMSARYVFKERVITDYLKDHEEYSEYVKLLYEVPVSTMSKTTMGQLLSARGNFTVFAPTNQAIAEYLERLAAEEKEYYITAPSWDSFTNDHKRDSIKAALVRNSVIDGGDVNDNVYELSEFPQANHAEFFLPNMNDRKLTVEWQPGAEGYNLPLINGKAPVDERNCDIFALNGIIHQVHQVLEASDRTLTDYLLDVMEFQEDGYLVMARAIQACGLLDTMRVWRDEKYEQMNLSGQIEDVIHYSEGGDQQLGHPAHRYIGFTIFAETDDFWRSQGIDPKDPDLMQKLQQWVLDNKQYSEQDGFLDNEQYTSEKNLLYQWVTYHILPFKLSAGKLVVHENEYGYSKVYPNTYTIPVQDYYTTMGKRRLLKLIETKVSGGVRINRFPKTDNSRKGTGEEIYCAPDKEGVLVDRESDMVVSSLVKNGCIYPLHEPLGYTQEVRSNLGRERIRFEAMSLFPEVMTNDIRNHGLPCPGTTTGLPSGSNYHYLENMICSEPTHVCYWTLFGGRPTNLNEDEIKASGRYDITIKLPPVPVSTTYELRYKVLATWRRGIVQIYFGDDLNHLYAPTIPIDLTLGEGQGGKPLIGWEKDTGDDIVDAEKDKRLRNMGFMMGCNSVECDMGTERNAFGYNTRRILLTQQLNPDKTYYLRFVNIMEGNSPELYLDYFEFCPKEVYDNPTDPEDIW